MSTLAILSALTGSVMAVNTPLFQKPPMGYNTYNAYGCTINDTIVRNAATAFNNAGFLNAGYGYFGIDCGWQATYRSANGSITYDTSEFPNGMSSFSQFVKGMGFRFALYTDEGYNSCDTTNFNRVGSFGYETQDAAQFAQWNVDYMKVDNCFATKGDNAPKDPRTDFPTRFGKMGTALRNAGVQGMLTCQWGVPYSSPTGLQGPAQWTPPVSTSFRVSDDIAQGWDNVMRIMNEAINVEVRGLSGPGNFADMDLLEVGNSGMTDTEQATHFAIWAMFKSPLWVSTQIQSLSSTAKSTLQNKGLIAINQDSLGKPVVLTERFSNDNDQFAGPLANGDVAVLLVDQTNTQRNLGIYFSALNITSATVTNLWTGAVTNNANNYFTTVSAHGSVPLRLSNIVRATPPNTQYTYYAASTGSYTGNAGPASCGGCSNGNKAGDLDGNSSVTISGIRTSQATQDVRFDYINCEIGYLGGGQYANVRGASVSVNGGAAQTVLFPLSGYNWDQDVYRSFKVRLSGFNTAGTNSITIAGNSAITQYAPDLDRIGVVA